MSVRCSYIKPDGNRCQAYALKNGKGFCFRHDPGMAEERERASSRGGRRTADLKKPEKDKAFIKKAAEKIEKIEKTETLTGEIVEDTERVDLKSHEAIVNYIETKVNQVEDNKTFAKPSMAEHFLIIKYIHEQVNILDKQNSERIRELEKIVFREGENDRRF